MSTREGDDPAYLGEAEVIKSTRLAILVSLEDLDEERWIPKSVIHDDSDIRDEGDSGELVVNRWWAEQEGLG
jgi:hypothetical protein